MGAATQNTVTTKESCAEKEETAASQTNTSDDNAPLNQPAASGRPQRFISSLYKLLNHAEEDKVDSVICWQPGGDSFLLRQPKMLPGVLPSYDINVKTLHSFQRQLNLYGFIRSKTRSGIAIEYHHEFFLRSDPALLPRVQRVSKSSKGRAKKKTNLTSKLLDWSSAVDKPEPIQSSPPSSSFSKSSSPSSTSIASLSVSDDAYPSNSLDPAASFATTIVQDSTPFPPLDLACGISDLQGNPQEPTLEISGERMETISCSVPMDTTNWIPPFTEIDSRDLLPQRMASVLPDQPLSCETAGPLGATSDGSLVPLDLSSVVLLGLNDCGNPELRADPPVADQRHDSTLDTKGDFDIPANWLIHRDWDNTVNQSVRVEAFPAAACATLSL